MKLIIIKFVLISVLFGNIICDPNQHNKEQEPSESNEDEEFVEKGLDRFKYDAFNGNDLSIHYKVFLDKIKEIRRHVRSKVAPPVDKIQNIMSDLTKMIDKDFSEIPLAQLFSQIQEVTPFVEKLEFQSDISVRSMLTAIKWIRKRRLSITDGIQDLELGSIVNALGIALWNVDCVSKIIRLDLNEITSRNNQLVEFIKEDKKNKEDNNINLEIKEEEQNKKTQESLKNKNVLTRILTLVARYQSYKNDFLKEVISAENYSKDLVKNESKKSPRERRGDAFVRNRLNDFSTSVISYIPIIEFFQTFHEFVYTINIKNEILDQQIKLITSDRNSHSLAIDLLKEYVLNAAFTFEYGSKWVSVRLNILEKTIHTEVQNTIKPYVKQLKKQIKQLKKALKELKTGKEIFDQVQQQFLIDINNLKALDSVVPQEEPIVINLLIKIKDLMNNNVFLKRTNKVLKRIEKIITNKKSLFPGLLCSIQGCFKASK